MADIKFFVKYDEEKDVADKIADYIQEHGSYESDSITIGYWKDAYDSSPENVIEYLVSNKALFPNLKKVFLGDIESEECEISWIMHTDAAPLINEFKLEELTIKGAEGLRLQNAKSETLTKLTLISGGLSVELLRDIVAAHLPNLEHLELYIGVDEYGFDGDITALEPFMQRIKFPKLTYLGLKNSEIADEICEKVVQSDIIAGLSELDISLGTLSDTGASSLLNHADKLKHLIKLDLTRNYISEDTLKKLNAAFKNTNVELLVSNDGFYIDLEDEWRCPYFTE